MTHWCAFFTIACIYFPFLQAFLAKKKEWLEKTKEINLSSRRQSTLLMHSVHALWSTQATNNECDINVCDISCLRESAIFVCGDSHEISCPRECVCCSPPVSHPVMWSNWVTPPSSLQTLLQFYQLCEERKGRNYRTWCLCETVSRQVKWPHTEEASESQAFTGMFDRSFG